MLTLVFRQLDPSNPSQLNLETLAGETAALLSDLTQAQVVTTSIPVLGESGQEVARCLRWHTHATRDRLVLETTWHHEERVMIFDAVRATVEYHSFTAIWAICQQAARAGFKWAAAWWNESRDPVLDNLWFHSAEELYQMEDDLELPPVGRLDLPDGRVMEWLHPSVKIMKRLIYFAEECKIDWEYLIIEDLMTNTDATYLELREGRNTVGLVRVLRTCFLPGMEGYDPRSPRPPVKFEIESFEVHPEHQGKGYGAILVREVQRLRRPVSTLDTYRRAEAFWKRNGFVRNRRRSLREDSNIFEWTPSVGTAVRIVTDDDE